MALPKTFCALEGRAARTLQRLWVCRRGLLSRERFTNTALRSTQRFTDRALRHHVQAQAIHSKLIPCFRGVRRPSSGTVFTRTYHIDRRGGQWSSGIGNEPGLDPTATESKSERSGSEHSGESDIRVVDYSNSNIQRHSVPAASLQGFLETTRKPDWATCRWIYVNGFNWDIVKCLGNTQGLHPLAIEDVMNTNNPTKVDWYDDHCFIDLTLQKLVDKPENQRDGRLGYAAYQPWRFSYDSRLAKDEDLPKQLPRTFSHTYHKFAMSIEQVSIFLTANDTVITMFERSGEEVFTPISTRLGLEHTLLRSSNDPSMLLQAVIDAVVDLSLPVGKAFSDAFAELELAVLTKPAVAQSKQVYVLRSGLTYFMDTILPIGSLVRTLCDHRGALSPHKTDHDLSSATSKTQQDFASTAISPKTQAYLKDVQDHITMLSNSTQMSIRSAENLTSLIFNTIAARQNESVRQLTVVSIFFLPLTFLTVSTSLVLHNL